MKHPAKELQGFDPARRAALLKLGRFAVYTAPVMTTLLINSEAQATHQGGNPEFCSPANLAANPGRAQHCAVGSSAATPSAEGFTTEDTSPSPNK